MDVDGSGSILGISLPGTEEGTIARKRSRRVSFADTTAVHVFDRDEDFDTPPEDPSASPFPSPYPWRSSAEAEDGDDTYDTGFPAPPIIFLRDMDSSSPGSAAGSVASVDDENFFGPVISTQFIQTGRPSDSGMSEDGNHDITLDSRTFYMHFLSTAPPQDFTVNSAGNLRTPDTASKGPLEELNVSEPGRKSSSGRDALTDMSLLTADPRTYDYGKLSPMLNVVMQKIEQGQQRGSPVTDIVDVNPDQVMTLTATEEEHREDTSCIDNGISYSELGAFSVAEEDSSMRNPVSSSTDPIQEANTMITNGLEKSQTFSQEDCNHDHVAVYPRVNDTVERHAKLPPQYNSFMSNFDLHHHHLFHESLSQDQRSGSNSATCASSNSKHGLEHCPPDQPSGDRLPAKSPNKSRKQLNPASELSVSLKVFKEKQSGDSDGGQPVNVDWNKVVCAISIATEQVLAASISKLNLQQLNTLGDRLDDFQMARKYQRLCIAARVEDCCGDQQKRLAEARSLHERLLYETAKLQVNNMKLAELQNKAQQCQIGIQECSFLKNKIMGSAQMNNASLHDTSLINSSDREEWLAVVSKKRLEYNVIQQKVENLSSLEYFCNNKADISCQSVMRSAEEQSNMRNRCRIIYQQEELPELMDVVKRDSKRDVILNYRNLLFQRIILNISNISSIFVNNSLNGTKIGQTFPDLDASVAFNYVFKAEENQSVSDLQLLQKKITETSLLLGNLVDVLDEIKFAKIKLLNLTSAAFVF